MKKDTHQVVVVSSWTDLTRDSVIYLFVTFATIKASQFLYRCFQSSEMSSFSMETHPEALRRDRILSSKLYFDVPLSKVRTFVCVCVEFTIWLTNLCLIDRFRSSTHRHTTSPSWVLRNCQYFPQSLLGIRWADFSDIDIWYVQAPIWFFKVGSSLQVPYFWWVFGGEINRWAFRSFQDWSFSGTWVFSYMCLNCVQLMKFSLLGMIFLPSRRTL